MISASVGTASLDIIADVVAVGDVADLDRITSELIPGVRTRAKSRGARP